MVEDRPVREMPVTRFDRRRQPVFKPFKAFKPGTLNRKPLDLGYKKQGM